MHAYLLSLLEETPFEVTQDSRNRATNKLVASVKQLWVLATPLAVELGVGYTVLTQDILSLAKNECRICWID